MPSLSKYQFINSYPINLPPQCKVLWHFQTYKKLFNCHFSTAIKKNIFGIITFRPINFIYFICMPFLSSSSSSISFHFSTQINPTFASTHSFKFMSILCIYSCACAIVKYFNRNGLDPFNPTATIAHCL